MARPRGWVICTVVEHLGLAIWVGGLIVIIGAVIPPVFSSLTMEPGGRLLTRVFDGYNRLVGIAILMLLTGVLWRLWRARSGEGRMAPGWWEGGLLMSMVTVAAVITFVLGPRAIALQEQAFAAQTETEKQAAYAAFFRSHHLVRALYLVNLALGIVLFAVRAKQYLKNKEKP